jgi:uncharacterized protein (DUF1697 family)
VTQYVALLRGIRAQLQRIVASAPAGFGTQPARCSDDVLFLKPPLAAAAAIKGVPVREGVDEVFAGPGVIYASRLVARASQSRLMPDHRRAPIYPSVTIRNWNTTTTLLQVMSTRALCR